MDLLASFARLPTKDAAFEPTTDQETNHIKARPDVLEAVCSIGRREEKQLDIDHTERNFQNGINLTNINLHRAFLGETNLRRIDFGMADLTNAWLIHTNLSHAFLNHAFLSLANLSSANLSGAILSEADLSRTNLSRADLSGANLRDVKNLTQEHLDSAYSDPDNPPRNLPEGLTWPE